MTTTELDPAPTPNLDLLREILTFVTEHPEAHDQITWGFEQPNQATCNTPMCIAGHALVRSGYTLGNGNVTDAHGQVQPVFESALEVLGLTFHEASVLFQASNALEDLTRIARDIASRVGQTL